MRTREFVAVDGEGITLAGGEHRYVLLSASTGECIEAEGGLSTKQVFEFLRLLARRDRILVGYGLSYDICHWLRDLTRPAREELARAESCWYSDGTAWWRIRWQPEHLFLLHRGRRFRRHDSGLTYDYLAADTIDCRVAVWDLLRFGETGLSQMLDAWEIGTQKERALIRRGKSLRDRLAGLSRDELREYNQTECRLIALWAERLRHALAECGISLSRYDGAGACAAQLLRAHQTPRPDGLDERLSTLAGREVARESYYGGRIQALQIGRFSRTVYHHDMASAYPWALSRLPDVAGKFVRWQKGEPLALWGFYRVRFRLPAPGRTPLGHLTPFPFRDRDRMIHYPRACSGWYAGPLVLTAQALWPTAVEVLDGYRYLPADPGERPYAWIEERYRMRQALAQTNPPLSALLKRALAALYGKTLQGAGGPTPAPYQSYCHAAWTTALVQAELLRVAARSPAHVIAFATDGLWSLAPHLNAAPGPRALGSWSATMVEELCLVKPGVYAYREHGRWTLVARGYRTRGERPELTPEMLLSAWDRDGPDGQVPLPLRRMLSLRLAVHWGCPERAGCFVEIANALQLSPDVGFCGPATSPRSVRWLPFRRSIREESCPYTPKAGFRDLSYTQLQALDLEFAQPDVFE